MADFAQQGPQGLLAALLLGGLDRSGNDAAHFAVSAMVGVDPEVEPLRACPYWEC